jgi:hypothetical protein
MVTAAKLAAPLVFALCPLGSGFMANPGDDPDR